MTDPHRGTLIADLRGVALIIVRDTADSCSTSSFGDSLECEGATEQQARHDCQAALLSSAIQLQVDMSSSNLIPFDCAAAAIHAGF